MGVLPKIIRTEYERHRYWWLNELRRLRAVKRVHGGNVAREKREVQRELLKLRSAKYGTAERKATRRRKKSGPGGP